MPCPDCLTYDDVLMQHELERRESNQLVADITIETAITLIEQGRITLALEVLKDYVNEQQ